MRLIRATRSDMYFPGIPAKVELLKKYNVLLGKLIQYNVLLGRLIRAYVAAELDNTKLFNRAQFA